MKKALEGAKEPSLWEKQQARGSKKLKAPKETPNQSRQEARHSDLHVRIGVLPAEPAPEWA